MRCAFKVIDIIIYKPYLLYLEKHLAKKTSVAIRKKKTQNFLHDVKINITRVQGIIPCLPVEEHIFNVGDDDLYASVCFNFVTYLVARMDDCCVVSSAKHLAYRDEREG